MVNVLLVSDLKFYHCIDLKRFLFAARVAMPFSSKVLGQIKALEEPLRNI
jgi:hypothetical protein